MKTDQHGYVALLAVLIVGTVCLAIGVSLLMTGIDSQRSTLVYQQSAQSRNLASACSEEALQLLRDNNAYLGSGSLTMGQGTCNYTVNNVGLNLRTVDVTATVSSTLRKTKLYVTIGLLNISVTSWQEVM